MSQLDKVVLGGCIEKKRGGSLQPAVHADNSLLEAVETPETGPVDSYDSAKSHESPSIPGLGLDETEGEREFLDGRFELLEILGSGNISTVYKTIDWWLSAQNRYQYVTIKILQRPFQANEGWLAFERALGKYQGLEHPNITRAYGFSRVGAKGFLLMEYLSGKSLGQSMRSWRTTRIPIKQALWIVNGIGQALIYAHNQGAVHGDLKPANVFLTDSGKVKVMDFGLALTLRSTAKDKADVPHFGSNNYSASTPSYASPELLDLRNPDPRDDVYALACITYELLTGQHPYGRVRATGAREFGLEVKPSDVLTEAQWDCLQKALALEHDKRTTTVTEFLASLEPSESNSSESGSSGWNRVRRVSLAVSVIVCAVALSFLLGRPHISPIEWLTESETTTAPVLSAHNDAGESTDADGTGPVAHVMDELADEVEVPTNEQIISVQEQLTSELETNIHQRSPSTRDGRDTPTDVEPELTNQSVLLEVNANRSVTDQQTSAKTPVEAGATTAAQAEKPVSAADKLVSITPQIAQQKTEESYSPDTLGQDPRKGSTPANPEQQTRDQGVSDRQAASLLELAESQIANRRLSLPAGNNALETYRQILSLVPEHEGAKQGISKVKQLYNNWFEAARERGDWDKAKALAQKSASIEPLDSAALQNRLRELEELGQAEQEASRQADENALEIAKAQMPIARPPPEIARIAVVKHELISDRDSPVAAIQAHIYGTVIQAEVLVDTGAGFLSHRLYDDGTHGDRISGDGEFYSAVTLGYPLSNIRYYVTATMDKGASVSSPVGADKETYLIKLPLSTSLQAVVINEFMASNDQTIADAQGGYDDWIELYNRSQQAIDLSGFYLSNNPENPKQWRFPNGASISAHSYLIVWADRSSTYTNMTSQPAEFHTNFMLSRRSGQILLVASDELGNSIIDQISFGRQREDRSMGRYPNGLGEFGDTRALPTPGRVNSQP